MRNGQQGRRINGTALEMIMRDVLTGMQEFTAEACRVCDAANLEILGVEQAGNASIRSADVIPFPPRCG